MEPMSTYVKDLAEYPDGVIARYDVLWTMPPRKYSVGLYSLAGNLTTAKPLTIMPERASRDLHVITLPEMFFVAAEAYYEFE